MAFAGGPDSDLDVLTEGGQKVHQALDGKGTGAIAHQGGNMGLLDAEDLARFRLGQAALPDVAIDLQGELCLQELLFRVGQAEVGEDVAGAL